MDAELRKRLEEAAYKIKCDIVDEDPQEIYCNAIEKGAMRGIEHGYEEAITQAKEWLFENYDVYGADKLIIASFEAYMRNLWEEKK